MPAKITYGVEQMLTEANAAIRTLTLAEAQDLLGRDDVLFVDLRDPRELARDGRIPGAFHCPRGMLEFWIDPASPYAKPQFQEDKTFVFFCGGGLRSALSAHLAQRMGLTSVAHIGGGFGAWKKQGAPIEPPEDNTEKKF
jgi:rhodanese-related sulfurtransferase